MINLCNIKLERYFFVSVRFLDWVISFIQYNRCEISYKEIKEQRINYIDIGLINIDVLINTI